jgi:hypothetical protein
MSFRIKGLPVETFNHLCALSDDELEKQGAVRRIADDRQPGHPCRASLEDSRPAMRFCSSTMSATSCSPIPRPNTGTCISRYQAAMPRRSLYRRGARRALRWRQSDVLGKRNETAIRGANKGDRG